MKLQSNIALDIVDLSVYTDYRSPRIASQSPQVILFLVPKTGMEYLYVDLILTRHLSQCGWSRRNGVACKYFNTPKINFAMELNIDWSLASRV